MYTYFLIPIFYLLYQLLWGYYCQFFILVALYPDISFLTFFGVHFRLSHTLCFIFSLFFSGRVPRHFTFTISRGTHLLVHHLLWLQHTPLCPKRTPLFHFLYFSGYAPPHTSLIVASAHSYSPKTYPDISLLPFLGVQPSTTPSTLFPPPRTKAYSGGVSPQSMLF